MTVMSGGLVYEWTQESSNYGIVDAYQNGTLQLRSDYDTLMSQYSKLNITLLEAQNSTATNLQPPKCSSGLISADGFETNFDIPSPPSGAAALISSGVSVSGGQTGSLVSVTATSVQDAVYATDGAQISGLAIKPVQGANRPGAASGLSTGSAPSSTGGSFASGSSSGASSTRSGASSTGSAAAATSSAAAFKAAVANGAAVAAVGMAVFAL